MTKTVKKKKESTRVQVYLDPITLDLLDYIQEHVPEVESRSAAIRWAAGWECKTSRPTRPKPRRRGNDDERD